jgi:hypothetical protein
MITGYKPDSTTRKVYFSYILHKECCRHSTKICSFKKMLNRKEKMGLKDKKWKSLYVADYWLKWYNWLKLGLLLYCYSVAMFVL